METKGPLNRRKHDRYFIEEIPVEGIGNIVEVSRKGLKIKKAPGFTPEGAALNFKLATLEIKTDVRWEDNHCIGLQFSGAFNDPKFIIKRIKRPKETVIPPQMKVTDEAIQQYKKDEILTKMASLLMEVDCPEPNISKIGIYIDEISELEEKKRAAEEEKPEGDGSGEEENAEEGTQDTPSLKDELIARAISSDAGDAGRVADITFAINRLGQDTVRLILRNYVHKRIFQSGESRSAFEGSETYDILKSVVFRDLCRLFGFPDIQPEGNALLSCETVGVEILVRESNGVLDNYYKSPSRLYSEVSRMYEKSLFGIDPVQINKYYFEKVLGAFEELASGYVLAQNTRNPHYSLPEGIKVSLNKNGLAFSYMAYLTILAVEFLLDRNKESGIVLLRRLKGRGMDSNKVLEFLGKTVSEAKTILKDFAVKGALSMPPLPTDSLDIGDYFGKSVRDARFEYLLQAFRNFNLVNSKRMALRCEDSFYAHFILGKILSSDGPGLNSKAFIVVPCRNVSDDQWYVRDFGYFDLLIFKDINKLPAFHMSTFLKLWNSFEGQIIVTFSCLDFLDYTNPQLYSLFNSSIVDFPSYYLSHGVYEKMLDHSISYLRPYIGNQQVDMDKYLSEFHTMKHINSDILLNKEIV